MEPEPETQEEGTPHIDEGTTGVGGQGNAGAQAGVGKRFTFVGVDNSAPTQLVAAEASLRELRRELVTANKSRDYERASALEQNIRAQARAVEAARDTATGTFDEGGVLFHLATGGGKKEYENPHESGEVRVWRSTVGAGDDAGAITAPSGPASACSTGSEDGEWIEIDLGPGRQLVVDHYCLRNDNSYGKGCYALRNWKLQGALQGVVMPAPGSQPTMCRVGKHVHHCKTKPTVFEFREFQDQAARGRTWHPHSVAQLAADIFNVNKLAQKKDGLTPLQKLCKCTPAQFREHCDKHHVELYWQNCMTRELDEPFWHTLRTHVDDTSLEETPWSVADWPIERNLASEVGYRFFRIKATGPNADPSNYRVACAGIELYGTLIEVSEGVPPPGSAHRFSAGAAMLGASLSLTGMLGED